MRSTLGANVHAGGVDFRVWAPDHEHLAVRVRRRGNLPHRLELQRDPRGYFSGTDEHGRAGDQYLFVLPDGSALPDPTSRFQPEGVRSWSECIDPGVYPWQSASWQRPGWRGQSIYELHVGAFTPQGTFRAAIEKLEHVAALGVEAIELMPLADFPGGRNWGYDGVALYAPARCYGRPDDLRALVDAAHAHGLAVILDVVYNHLGPDGNYLARYAKEYFDAERHTPWGQAFNLSGSDNGPVREYFLANAARWLDEYRFDGLRLDATHAIEDPSKRHLLADIAAVAHERGAFAIAEDDRNSTEILQHEDGSGHRLDAVWADDFHHQVRVALTGTRESYFRSYQGTPDEVARTLEHGWFFTGQPFPHWRGRPRGDPCRYLTPAAFVYCIENHDQVGNRAKGERLEHLVGIAAFRAASALLLLSPYPPMLFMGQEWAASSPFLFFTDHAGELGRLVSEGRKKEFATEGFKTEDVPDPQAPATFERSKLIWDEVHRLPHAWVLELYRECLRQRAAWVREAAASREHWAVRAVERAVGIRYAPPGQPVRLIVSALWGPTQIAVEAREWRQEFTSGEATLANGVLTFQEAATVLLVDAGTAERSAG